MGVPAAIGSAARGARIGGAAGLEWLARLAGPIFDKELRISARRRRNYALRFLYLAALTVFVYVIWVEEVGRMGTYTPQHRAARMAVAGEHIAWDIIAFQFLVLPLVAAVMLSASAGEEIRQRTLATLMVTPVSGFRIALGKLLAKLLQVLLLLAISMPLLMLVRVMGGVDWEKVAAALAVTATTCLVVGALSLLLSTFFRRGYMAILATLVLAVGFCLVASFGGVTLVPAHWPLSVLLEKLVIFVNPAVLVLERMRLMGPGAAVWFGGIHAVLALGVSAALVAWAGRRMRKIGLGLAMAEARSAARWERWMRPRAVRRRTEADPIRRVTGSPILWRERQVRFGLGRFAGVILWGTLAGSVAAFDCVGVLEANTSECCGIFEMGAVILLVAAMLLATVQSAPVLAAEREAGTLALLLATPFDPGRIVVDKALGALVNSMSVWVLLPAHIALGVVMGYFHPILLIHVVLLLAGVLALVTGSGLLVGSWVRRSSTAVMVNILVVATIFIGLPLMVETSHQFLGTENLEGLFTGLHPVGQIIAVAQGASHADWLSYGDLQRHRVLGYYLDLPFGSMGWAGATVLVIVTAGVQAGAGLLAAALAARRLRRG